MHYYHNAANLSEKYNGLHARIKKLSSTAIIYIHVPINLVASNYVPLVQEIYVF